MAYSHLRPVPDSDSQPDPAPEPPVVLEFTSPPHVLIARLRPMEGEPGVRRDYASGRKFYSADWLSDAEVQATAESLAAVDERFPHAPPHDAVGAEYVRRQRETRPADGWVGPGSTPLSEVARSHVVQALTASALRAAARKVREFGVVFDQQIWAEPEAARLEVAASEVERVEEL